MARKRKIPARKHHGVRDPLKQQEVKEKKLKNIVNNPPETDADQRLSYKFKQFKKLADDAKAGKKIKRIHSGQEDKPTAAVTEKNKRKGSMNDHKFRNIKQLTDETDEEYLKRVNRITRESLREAQYEAKYGVNVVRDPKSGAITIKKRPKNEIDQLLAERKKRKRGAAPANEKSKGNKPLDPTVVKELVKQAIREDEEEKTLASKGKLEEYKCDSIKFGEVVHAPPTLSTLPRHAEKSETVPRPGKKQNLLLKSLLDTDAKASDVPLNPRQNGINKSKPKIGTTKPKLKGKRKDLPAATRRMLEGEQKRFIELYRNLKKPKETPT